MKLKFSASSEIARNILRCFADSSAIDPAYGKLFCVDSSFVCASGRFETFTLDLDDQRLEFCPFIAMKHNVKVVGKRLGRHREGVICWTRVSEDNAVFNILQHDGWEYGETKERISLCIEWALAQEGVEEIV